jgi:DNA-binding GntR family transcriptional regulator
MPPKRTRGSAPAPKSTGSQMVYEALRRAIMSLELAPGTSLDEGSLCSQFKVSRTPVREALIRLSADGLVEVYPNRGAKVASLEFADVVDHYEAMDVFMPITCHFAASRRTPADIERLKERLAEAKQAMERKHAEHIVRTSYDFHIAVAAACHNRCIERGYRQMLADKLRIQQHGLSGPAYSKGYAVADRFAGTIPILEKIVRAIEKGDPAAAERSARELNGFVRGQVVELLTATLGQKIRLPLVAHTA